MANSKKYIYTLIVCFTGVKEKNQVEIQLTLS